MQKSSLLLIGILQSKVQLTGRAKNITLADDAAPFRSIASINGHADPTALLISFTVALASPSFCPPIKILKPAFARFLAMALPSPDVPGKKAIFRDLSNSGIVTGSGAKARANELAVTTSFETPAIKF